MNTPMMSRDLNDQNVIGESRKSDWTNIFSLLSQRHETLDLCQKEVSLEFFLKIQQKFPEHFESFHMHHLVSFADVYTYQFLLAQPILYSI